VRSNYNLKDLVLLQWYLF